MAESFEEELAAEIANLVRRHVAIALKQRDDKIAVLEARIIEMENHVAQLKDCGGWRAGEKYRKNNFVSHHGSAWICQRDTQGTPGLSSDWRLVVRKGRDARAAA